MLDSFQVHLQFLCWSVWGSSLGLSIHRQVGDLSEVSMLVRVEIAWVSLLVNFKICMWSPCLSCWRSALGLRATQGWRLPEFSVAGHIESLLWVYFLVWLWVSQGFMCLLFQGSSGCLCAQ